MGTQVRTNQQIAWRTAIGIWLSLSREPDHHPVIHPGRNLHLEPMGHKLISISLARRAGSLDELAAPVAAGARRQRDQTHALAGFGMLCLSSSSTVGTGFRLRPRPGAAPCAGHAFLGAGNRNLAFASLGCFFQGKIQVIPQIHAPARPGTRSRALTEEVAEHAGQIIEPAAEKIAELKIVHEIFSGPAFTDSRMTCRIVLATFRIVR